MQLRKPADLARLVKTRRQAQGHTQQAVADAAGITRQSLARIERGNGGVSFDTLLLILDFLELRLDGHPTGENFIQQVVKQIERPPTLKVDLRELEDLHRKASSSAEQVTKSLATSTIWNLLQANLALGDPDSWRKEEARSVHHEPNEEGSDS